MRRLTGVGVLVLGIVLVVAGMDATDSLSSRLSRLFTGSPTDRAIWLLLGGAVAVIVGLSMMTSHRREKD